MDYAYPVAVGNGLVYVASSSDHAIQALDLASGKPRWAYFTEGPVRLAPAVHDGKVYASSDDGFVYCLDGLTGRLLWRYRPDIPDERLIGNEQMVSRWPARSGVLVAGGKAYSTFGMWSAEGVVIVCLDAETGAELWTNDTSGTHYMTQPHYEAMGGVSPQGYLALCGAVLVVPCGRATPAFFAAETGKFIYHENEGLFPGGAWTMTCGDLAFTPCELLQKPNSVRPLGSEAEISPAACLVALRAPTGAEVFHLQGALWGVVTDQGRLNVVGPGKILSVDLAEVLTAAGGEPQHIGSSVGHFVEAAKHTRWQTPVDRVYELIQAGNTLIAGQRGAIACFAADDGRKLWSTELKGDVHELLVAGSALLVSTTAGEVHCFRPGQGGEARVTRTARREIPVPAAIAARVKGVLTDAGVSAGYGLVIGEADEAYLAALARQSSLVWQWAAGARDVAALRSRLADAGLYGTRIAIHNTPASLLPYVDYCANLVVFRVGSAADLAGSRCADLVRVLRPCGGVLVASCSESLRPQVERWLSAGGVPRAEQGRVSVGFRVERGPLPGAGAWTHQYADAGKSGASADQLVRLPLKVLWFGSVGPADIVSRHYRAPVPLALDGFLYVAGIDYLHAIDAYNGRVLWERRFPEVGRWPAAYRGGCVAADSAALYVLRDQSCLRLARDTGATLLTYEPPAVPARDGKGEPGPDDNLIWEYLALADDVVVGALGQPNVQRSWWSMAHPANRLLFALDKATGKPNWTYQSESAVDSNAIAIEGDRLFLIDGLPAVEIMTRPKGGAKAKAKFKARTVYRAESSTESRVLKALDVRSGTELWRTSEIGGSQNSLYVANGVVLATVPIWHGLRAKREGPTLSAFSAQNGQRLWTREGKTLYPVIIGNVAYVPNACDLRTGEPVLHPDPLTGGMVPLNPWVPGGCGRISGCPQVMMKRSGSMGFFDLRQFSGIYHHPNMRANCWINVIPACGLVLAPEGSSSCPCAYNYKASLALMPATRQNHWGLYTGLPRRRQLPITQLRLNFGAPGDRPDDDGNIWFAFPRPSTAGPRGGGGMGRIPFASLPVELAAGDGVQTSARHPDWAGIDGTDVPWLYSCSLAGPFTLSVRLAPEGAAVRRYRVTLFFPDLQNDAVSARLSVSLQGKVVLPALDVRREADAATRPLTREFTVEAADTLTLDLASVDGGTPVVSGLQVKAIGD